jgi:hypothetical protein
MNPNPLLSCKRYPVGRAVAAVARGAHAFFAQ